MEPDALHALARRLRRAPLAGATDLVAVDHGPAAVWRLLPHRPPMLLVDSITGVDLAGQRVAGRRRLDPTDPVFAGHFPGDPVYPGVLLIEMIGQLGLCLASFLERGSVEVGPEVTPARVRATRVRHAVFEAPAAPGAELQLLGQIVEADTLTGVLAGQIWHAGTLCANAVVEVLHGC